SNRSSGPLRVLVSDRIKAVEAQLAGLPRPLARLGEGEHMHRTDAHVARAAVGDVPVNPLLAAALGNPEVEAAAVGVHAGRLRLLHLERREPVECPRHCPRAPFYLTSCPSWKSRYWQTTADK